MSRNGQKQKKPRPSQVAKIQARALVKEREKVAVEVHRLRQLEEGDKNPHIQELRKQVSVLLAGHNELVTKFNSNAQGMAQSIQHLDARVGAMMFVLDDIVRGGVGNVSTMSAMEAPSPGHRTVGGVHWQGYIHMYLKQLEMELEELRAKNEAAGAEPLRTPEAEAIEDDEPVVFGGKDDSDGEASTEHATGTTG